MLQHLQRTNSQHLEVWLMNTPHDEHENDVRFGEQPLGSQPAAPRLSGPQPALGWNHPGPRDPRRKSPLLAVLLSIMPGLGQVYVGNYRRGFIHILVVAALITLLANDLGPLAPLGGLGLAFFWMYNMIDAGRRATHYNMLLEAEAGAVFPEDIDFTSASGSRAGGIVLIVVGFLFLMNTRYHWHFDWVEEWWPLGFMILGAYLIYKDMQARKEKESNTRDRKRDLEE
jgi:TM2 domain-containing membrane protein YozV